MYPQRHLSRRTQAQEKGQQRLFAIRTKKVLIPELQEVVLSIQTKVSVDFTLISRERLLKLRHQN